MRMNKRIISALCIMLSAFMIFSDVASAFSGTDFEGNMFSLDNPFLSEDNGLPSFLYDDVSQNEMSDVSKGEDISSNNFDISYNDASLNDISSDDVTDNKEVFTEDVSSDDFLNSLDTKADTSGDISNNDSANDVSDNDSFTNIESDEPNDKSEISIQNVAFDYSLNKEIWYGKVGKTVTLKITDSKVNIYKKTWKSSDSTIAKVSSKGTVTAVKPGECEISCTFSDKSGTTTLFCRVYVYDVESVQITKSTDLFYNRDLVFNDSSNDKFDVEAQISINTGTATIKANSVFGGDNSTLTISSSNKKAVKVDKPSDVNFKNNTLSFKCTAVGYGTSKITINFAGKKASFNVTVKEEFKASWISKLGLPTNDKGVQYTTYNGKAQKPKVVLSNSAPKKLTYKTTYEMNIDSGTAYANIEGTGNFSGMVVKSFKINPFEADFTNVKCSCTTQSTYNGKLNPPTYTVKAKIGSKWVKLKKDKDFFVETRYKDPLTGREVETPEINAGDYREIITLSYNFNRYEKEVKYRINKAKVSKLTLSMPSKIYINDVDEDGSQNLKIKLGKVDLSKEDFRIQYKKSGEEYIYTRFPSMGLSGKYTVFVYPGDKCVNFELGKFNIWGIFKESYAKKSFTLVNKAVFAVVIDSADKESSKDYDSRVSSDDILTEGELADVSVGETEEFIEEKEDGLPTITDDFLLNKTDIYLFSGETVSLKADNSSGQRKITSWKSSNTNIATVDKYGKVTAQNPGQVTIYAYDGKGSGKCTVNVYKVSSITSKDSSNASAGVVMYEGFDIEGSTVQIPYVVSYDTYSTDASELYRSHKDQVKISCSDKSVATASVKYFNGKDLTVEVTFHKFGDCAITVKYGSKSAVFTIKTRVDFRSLCKSGMLAPEFPYAANDSLQEQYIKYTGKAHKPKILVSPDIPVKATYKVRYSNNVNVGMASVTVTGTGIFEGSYTYYFKISPFYVDFTNVKYSVTTQKTYVDAYNPPDISIQVKQNGKWVKLKNGKDYEVNVYNKELTKKLKEEVARDYTEYITFIGNYEGTEIKEYYRINKLPFNKLTFSVPSTIKYTGREINLDFSVKYGDKKISEFYFDVDYYASKEDISAGKKMSSLPVNKGTYYAVFSKKSSYTNIDDSRMLSNYEIGKYTYTKKITIK